MRKIIITALIVASSVSCSTYRQITTIESDNVKMNDNGNFVYESPSIKIAYNFWSENGDVDFLVTNDTDKDIYLNMDKSHFIKNGFASDYYQQSTLILTEGASSSSSSSRHRSTAASGNLSPVIPTSYGNLTKFAVGVSDTDSRTYTSKSEVSIELPERELICIPAHASKYFGQFHVSSELYRECGFNRNPTRRKPSIKEFTAENTPVTIENRLVFIVDGAEVPVTNVFFTSIYQNVREKDMAIRNQKGENCDGSSYIYEIPKYEAANRFYIKYELNGITDSSESASNSSSNSGSGRGFSFGKKK